MKTKSVLRLLVRAFTIISFVPPMLAADETVQTDVGTLDKETAAKAFPSKPPYSPYAGLLYPTARSSEKILARLNFIFTGGVFQLSSSFASTR